MTQRTKAILKAVSAVLALLLLIAAALYANIKSFTVKKVSMPDGQEIYLMGTFHAAHFRRYANYSIEEMLNAICHIGPDAVLIEARESRFAEYGVVDGPVDMCVAYCYCLDRSIPIEMVDYWEIDDDYRADTTNGFRDDCIHRNIMEKRALYPGGRVLVICGFGHLAAQTSRLAASGGRIEPVPGIAALFGQATPDFSYPGALCEVWERRVLFYAHTVPRLVQADESLSPEIKAAWSEDVDGVFYNEQMEFCQLFRANALYFDGA